MHACILAFVCIISLFPFVSHSITASISVFYAYSFQVCWAHPRFGQVLGSCGYDRRVVVWERQERDQGFTAVYSNDEHSASVNTLSFAPESAGLVLAAGSSDGTISILSHAEGAPQQWSRQAFSAHFNGVLALSWAPIGALSASIEGKPNGLLLASGGADNRVRLWECDPSKARRIITAL